MINFGDQEVKDQGHMRPRFADRSGGLAEASFSTASGCSRRSRVVLDGLGSFSTVSGTFSTASGRSRRPRVVLDGLGLSRFSSYDMLCA